MTTRSVASTILFEIIYQQKPTHIAFKHKSLLRQSESDISTIKDYCYGALRWYDRYIWIIDQYIKKPIKPKDGLIQCILLLGLYQIFHTNTPSYALVSEMVNCAKAVKKQWASGLINKTLKNIIKDKEQLLAELCNHPTALYAHPSWLIERIQFATSNWEAALLANNERAPLFLRVNEKQTNKHDFLALLKEHDIAYEDVPVLTNGIKLCRSTPVTALPGYDRGLFSVQDGAGQLISHVLQIAPSDRVLDACAAPGSKTTQILETAPEDIDFCIIEKDPKRATRIKENIDRLHLPHPSQYHLVDATDLSAWWDKQLFDKVLLDVPCSGTGVIRRHPDIKVLRHPDDITTLVQTQYQLLTAAWKTLKPGGILLYTTCSILSEENDQNIERFMQTHDHVALQALSLPVGQKTPYGWQILPGQNGFDGFYYSLLKKSV